MLRRNLMLHCLGLCDKHVNVSNRVRCPSQILLQKHKSVICWVNSVTRGDLRKAGVCVSELCVCSAMA